MCTIPIYFCNIPLKHLKHLKYTIATCTFSVASACCLDEWRLVNAELDASAELNAAEWHRGHQCGAHQWHGPRQGHRQTDGARSWQEARVRAGAHGAGGRGHAAWAGAAQPRARSVLELRHVEKATRAGAAQARHKASGQLIRGPKSVRPDDL